MTETIEAAHLAFQQLILGNPLHKEYPSKSDIYTEGCAHTERNLLYYIITGTISVGIVMYGEVIKFLERIGWIRCL